MLKISHLSKQYMLGQIGGTTLREEIQRWNALRRHQEDPTKKIGADDFIYGEPFLALDDVSFEVQKGERLGIIGHNGAGKSTLLKLISRITAPTSGDIWMNGRVASMLEVGTGFHGELTGRENIYMNGAILGMKKKEIDEKIEDIIEFSECRQFIDTPVKRYSSGMYVKLAFSVAAHLDSEIMIMDEVLAVGDMSFQKKCLKKMNDVSRSDGRTILYVSHNMNTIRQLCDRCIVLEHGQLRYEGDLEEGIRIYIGTQGISGNCVALENMDRDPEFSPHTITMKEIECLGDTSIAVGSKLDFRLHCISSKKIDEVFLRIIIRSDDSTPITMFTTQSGISVDENENFNIEMCLDVSKLAPGTYTISPVLYEVNEFGNNIYLDGLKEVFVFEITQSLGFNNNMQWQQKYWGYFFNNPLQIRKGFVDGKN